MTPDEFERDVLKFMARIDEHMANQTARCDNHASRLSELSERTSSLEATRNYAKGVIKTVAVGVPALGSVAWFVFEVGKFLRSMK